MTERLTETELHKLVLSIDFPPLKFKKWEVELRFPDPDRLFRRTIKPDFITDLEWENQSYKFIVEAKRQATPKTFDSAIHQVKDYVIAMQTLDNSTTYYPMLIVPYLNEKQLERLAVEKISGLDLSGNGLVIVPDKIFVRRFGAKNKFPANAPIKNVFRGVSSLVPRVFLVKPQYNSVTEILDEITKRNGKTTFATVSKVLKTLEEELLISRQAGIRLLDGKNLLRNLRENYRRPQIAGKLTGKTSNLAEALLKLNQNAASNSFACAIEEPARYAVMASSNVATKFYTESMKETLAGVEFNETNRFPNLEIIETQDPTVYFDRRYESMEGVYYTAPLQVYLALASGGKREKEIAEQVELKIMREVQNGK